MEKAKKPILSSKATQTKSDIPSSFDHKDEQKPQQFVMKTSIWRKIWWFIWEDTSVWSWIVNVILAFVIIKFLVYPGLGFALGTTHPIVAVVSGSMEHDESFDKWWTVSGPNCNKTPFELYSPYGITKEQFNAYSFHNGFNKGDLMILKRTNSLQVGDVVVFDGGMSDPIIHRAILLANDTVSTKGDHNCASAAFERDISSDRLIGKAILRIPFLGWIKIGFVELVGLITGRA